MKRRFSTTLIGLFILGALFLTVAGFLVFGGQGWWRDTQTFVVYFDESVHGLERGSSVRFKGVRIGQVNEVAVLYDPDVSTRARVVCEIDRSRVLGPEGVAIDIRDADTLHGMIEQGLQARMNVVGITGMLYLELDFFAEDPDEVVARHDPEHPVVPSVPSALAKLTENVSHLADRLEQVDFEGVADSASQLLDTANEVLTEADIATFVAEVTETVRMANELLRSDEIGSTIAAGREAFEEFRRVARRLDDQIDPIAESVTASSEELQRTLGEAAEALGRFQDLAGPRYGLGPQAQEALSSMNDAARAVQRLADFLERNPQAILSGRRGEEATR